jgi:hypothetical protein
MAADWDGDTRDDLLAVYSQSAGATICWGGAGATALTSCPFQTFLGSGSAAGDVDGDGRLDLIMSGFSAVDVLRNLGGRAFATPVAYSLGQGLNVGGLFVADLDGDRRLDVVAARSGSDDGYDVLLGNAGGFAAPVFISDGNHLPEGPIGGDFDNDGHLDFLDPEHGQQIVLTLFRGDGHGGFVAGASFTVGQGLRIAVGDVDGDSTLDLVISHPVSLYGIADPEVGNVSVLRGRGDGTFTAAVDFPAGPSPFFLALADFNRDGRLDIAVGNGNSIDPQPLRILRGHGDGTFAPAVAYDAGTDNLWQMVSGDFDGDGAPDLVYGHGDGHSGAFQEPALLRNLTR